MRPIGVSRNMEGLERGGAAPRTRSMGKDEDGMSVLASAPLEDEAHGEGPDGVPLGEGDGGGDKKRNAHEG